MDINLFRKALASKQGLLKEDHAIESSKSLLAKASDTLRRKRNEDTAEEALNLLTQVKNTLKHHPLYGMDLKLGSSVHTLEWYLDSAYDVVLDAFYSFTDNRGARLYRNTDVAEGQKLLVLAIDEIDDILKALKILF